MTPNNEYLCCENVAQRRASEYMQPNWDNLLGPLCVPLVDRFVNLLKDIHVTSWYDCSNYDHSWQDAHFVVLLSDDPLQSYVTMSCHVLLNINHVNIF